MRLSVSVSEGERESLPGCQDVSLVWQQQWEVFAPPLHQRPLPSHTHREAPPPTPLIEGIMSDVNDCFNCCLISGEWDY